MKLSPLLYRLRKHVELDGETSKTAIKTALAASICYFVVTWTGSRYGVWSVMTAMLVTQSHLGGSLVAAWTRISSAVIGAAAGSIIVLTMGEGGMAMTIALLATLLICAVVRPLRDVSRMAGVTTALFFLIDQGHIDPVSFSLDMFAAIGFGLGVGLAVTMAIWPARASRQSVRRVAQVVNRCETLYALVIERYLDGKAHDEEIDELIAKTRQSLRQVDQLLGAGWNEPGGRDAYASLSRTLRGVMVLFRHIQSMDAAVRRVPARLPDEPMAAPLRDLAVATQAAMEVAAESILQRRKVPQNPLLSATLATAEARLEERRHLPTTRPIDVILHHYAIFYAMRVIAESLIGGLGEE